jgi:valyl-tRNA synthetase
VTQTTQPTPQLAPRYEAAAVESRIYERWMESGAFTPDPEPPPGAGRFVVIQPPPNVTGALHLGHALTATVEDILVRYHRMRGDDTLWLPGVDHASISAQFVLDRIIAAEGETRQSLGRERYLERMWRFMDETRGVIGTQHRRLGASLDWTRARFTMDEGSARAVRTAFKRLWDAGLVYRGEALVNWCPRCRTTISDLENIHREETGTLWTIRYHLEREDGTPDPDGSISVATTRPETLLGDTGVAVHPDDDRYRALVGRHAILPFLGRRLPIVADDAVEREFGTGAVKVTPAHDAEDYELGKRHGLAAITVLDEEARINDAGGDFAGLDRYDARREIVDRLREAGDLEDERPHRMVIGHCDKCDTVVEPRLSVQWFIRVKPLAERALASVRADRTRITPDHFEKVYTHWMENIHDWAVSRQLWWGHRIPAWYCPNGHVTVSDVEGGPDACAECGAEGADLNQESDIFDTWFSSGLWPFSTLGWPDDTPDLRRFYPTSVMETAYEILFFWVARMMMLGLFCTGVEPFHTVYLHGIVRDPYGQKMSKTKGNVVDPLDQRLTDAKLTGGRNFTNKLWNAARFVLGARLPGAAAPEGEPTLAERWIATRLATAVETATRQLDELDIAGYVATVHRVTWDDYCDWFLEAAKVELRREDASPGELTRVWRCAATGLATLVRLAHPVMPFVTESIWETLREAASRYDAALEPLLIRATWPSGAGRDAAAEHDFDALADLIRALRNLRTSSGVAAGAWVPAAIVPSGDASRRIIEANLRVVETLAHVRPVTLTAAPSRPQDGDTPSAVTSLGTVQLPSSAEERDAAKRRQRADRDETQRGIDRLRTLLADARFLERAPREVVERERARLVELEARMGRLTGRSSG